MFIFFRGVQAVHVRGHPSAHSFLFKLTLLDNYIIIISITIKITSTHTKVQY